MEQMIMHCGVTEMWAWVQVQTLVLTRCVALGKPLDVSVA